jgi:hypothetical protein
MACIDVDIKDDNIEELGTANIHEVAVMTWGIPTATFLQIHVAMSLIGIAAGLVVLYGLLTARPLGGWTALFLAATILTSLTGFPLPPFGFDPARALAVISLILLGLATAALYVFNLKGAWRWIYVSCAVTALYLNVFVAVVQSFQKLSFLQPLAPTQSEPPFVLVQLAALAAFAALGVLAAIRFHPEVRTGQ